MGSLLINCLHAADDVRVSISRPVDLAVSLLHTLEHLPLKSSVMTEQIGSSFFV